jgi:hypothetical protein
MRPLRVKGLLSALRLLTKMVPVRQISWLV